MIGISQRPLNAKEKVMKAIALIAGLIGVAAIHLFAVKEGSARRLSIAQLIDGRSLRRSCADEPKCRPALPREIAHATHHGCQSGN